MRSDRYQIALIILGIVATAFFGVFFYRELFPEYRIYQADYSALEEFHATYTGQPPPAFQSGVKQIVFEREDKGPAAIDRCISCHVALQIPDFSPTKIAHDINGSVVRDESGKPVQIPNENYIWVKLEEKIAWLTDPKKLQQLRNSNQSAKADTDFAYAEKLKSLKTAQVNGYTYNVEKVLAMHPLIGKETRPFEYHSIDEYGCTSCHGGNGRGLTTDKAHGPVFDGGYETEYMGRKPEFLEHDKLNDPQFAKVFNDKPGDSLLFQTTPILVGHLIESKCIQCHEQSSVALQGVANTAGTLALRKKNQSDAIENGYKDEKLALLSLIQIKDFIASKGIDGAIDEVKRQLIGEALQPIEYIRLSNQMAFLTKWAKDGNQKGRQEALDNIDSQLFSMLGSAALQGSLTKSLQMNKGSSREEVVDHFLETKHTQPDATGTLFSKSMALNVEKSIFQHVEDTQTSLSQVVNDEKAVASMASDVDLLTKDYHRGGQLFISQACYACHRIGGLSRGGVGPELTRAGGMYPWYMKEKLSWPQGSLTTSTMPNMHLDHVEMEDLMTFLFGQNGPAKAVSETDYKIAIQQWESGRKMPLENPIPPSQLHDLRYSMTIFATQGCAACHRLIGFQSNVGYVVEKEEHKKASFDSLHKESQWFRNLFPEFAKGSDIVRILDEHAAEIDRRIVDNVKKGSLLEEIEEKYPQSIESLYSEFRFAHRAKDSFYKGGAAVKGTDEKKLDALSMMKVWKARVHRVLMMYIQEYGLGRVIGPSLNWSGVYRSDQWLMEHFHNPAAHVPKSIMPIFPFDDSKFNALTYMLDVLGRRNRDQGREMWQHDGFDPAQAFQSHCSQCHGEYLQGNGPISEWIYPIPKNLRNAEFLRNLTRENAIDSIMHGVKGTPMPPWGETPKDKENYDGKPIFTSEEISSLTDWIYSSLPGSAAVRGSQEVPKWQYMPSDVLKDMHAEGGKLLPGKQNKEGDLFDALSNPAQGDRKNAYYIKKKYYTENNIEEGKRFFEANCAICHGADADGSGLRAGVMQEAKPRMLTNLDWLKSQDDLRLLRSIKYGVAGTAMTPWGDLTSAQQRLQLVIFIRSLSRDDESRDQFAKLHYKAFNASIEQIEEARAAEYASLVKLQNELESARLQQRSAYEKASSNPAEAEQALAAYKKQLELAADLKKHEKIDESLVSLKIALKKESDIYNDIGIELNRADIGEVEWERFLKILTLNQERFTFSNGQLVFDADVAKENEITALTSEIAADLDAQIAKLRQEEVATSGKIISEQRTIKLTDIEARAVTLKKAKRKLLSGIEETGRLRLKEADLFKKYKDEA